jgi:hypothetical protein
MAPIRWGLSVLDWHAHAVDEGLDHPLGCCKAQCGHLLMMVTELHDQPDAKACPACAVDQYNLAIGSGAP